MNSVPVILQLDSGFRMVVVQRFVLVYCSELQLLQTKFINFTSSKYSSFMFGQQHLN